MTEPAWPQLVEVVLTASEQAVDLMAASEVAARWADPSVLSEMTVGMLAAHLGQMVTGPVGWIQVDPPDPDTVTVGSTYSSYQPARLDDLDGLRGGVPTTIRQWAEDGSKAGAAKVVEQARTAIDVGRALLADADPDRLIPSAVTPGVATRLEDYLRTRCVELVVHADDLAASVGLDPPGPDPVAAATAIDVLLAMCRHRAGDLAVLRALARPDRSDPGTLRAL